MSLYLYSGISAEEIESKYHWIVASSLLALGQIITTLAADDAEDFDVTPFAEILDVGKFWKHGKSSSSTV